ncbi:MAG TPA: glycosyltransferase family 9 protein [Noviherbaspirillum sp.]|uniref:glycosyltransferase family 9 protein n=1 Tax=Noviherbaspirillum sp. TaxID=1926288 RepID=UPI002B45FA8B|nr:glycosyltransferase family 9 protein [Noviherbaspirillum sp.]HJV85989.1 glycosyltransferase family 9 protein [Noviherbaspirillum sp.]
MALSETCARTKLGTLPLQRLGIRKLAVFRALQLGDMLCAVPALRALRAWLPDTHITLVGLPWAAQFASRFHAYIDDFIAFPGHPQFPEQPVRKEQVLDFYRVMTASGFDLALQLHGSGDISNGIVAAFGARAVAGYATEDSNTPHGFFVRYPDSGPEPLRLLNLANAIGAPPAGVHLEFPVTAADEAELRDSAVADIADGLEPGSYLCIHPGARLRNKCWAPQRFAEVADRLADESSLRIVLTGSGQEADLTSAVASHMHNPAVNAAAPISIGAMAALMRKGRLLISNDTGVSHIAAGLRLPSVVIFTIADMSRWAPLDQGLHRCLRDPEGAQVDAVVEHARALLREHGHDSPA